MTDERARTWVLYAFSALAVLLAASLYLLTAPPGRSATPRTQEDAPVAAHPVRATDLTITLWPRGPAGRRMHWQVQCPGHDICAHLPRYARALSTEARPPCAPGVPHVREALVQGRIQGRWVDVFLDQRDGCGAARWRTLAPLLRAP